MLQSDQGANHVIGGEGWKTMSVKAWYQRECDDLEMIQNSFGR